MAEVIWSPEARSALHEMAEYISLDSVQYAAKTVSRITASVERLEKFPLSGRIVPELGVSTIREIVTVLHSRQDLLKHLLME